MLIPPFYGRATTRPATIKVFAAGPLGKGVEVALVQLDLVAYFVWDY